MSARNVALRPDHRAVIILDQTRLPNETVFLELEEAEEMFAAIQKLQVRGAPALGVFAACALYVLAVHDQEESNSAFRSALQKNADYLVSSRPTAVNLGWAARRMTAVADGHPTLSPKELLPLLYEECYSIHKNNIATCRAIAENGLRLLRNGDGILTHCNAGPLATARYGTALGPILLGTERGMKFRVFADETRPLLQGARLTSYELDQAGVDVTLICDNMAAAVMQKGWVQACLVGCDRVAANGDVANKIGTCGVAVLARHYGIPFYVLGPSSSIDFSCASGRDIQIEERDPEEIRSLYYRQPMAPLSVKCYNPAFDVTDASFISGIVTEFGVCRPPYPESLARLRSEIQR